MDDGRRSDPGPRIFGVRPRAPVVSYQALEVELPQQHSRQPQQHGQQPRTYKSGVWGLIAAIFIIAGGSFFVAMTLGHKVSVVPTREADAAFEGGVEPVSLILTADPGDMVGMSEESFILREVEDQEPEPDWSTMLCMRITRGKLFGQKVVVAVTGIGQVRAALCMKGLLQAHHAGTRSVKEIIFLGTSGFSPAKGGIVDSDNCSHPNPAETLDHSVLGDVCVSPFATNWDCQKCVWPQEVTSACAPAPCSLHSRWDLFGDFACTYFTSTDLSDEVLAVAKMLELPHPSSQLMGRMDMFWEAMSNGTGQPYLDRFRQRTRPMVRGYTECAEASSNTFWVGNPYDEIAREYVAVVINAAHEHSPAYGDVFGDYVKYNITKKDTVAVSAMEGVGWMSTIRMGEVYLSYPHIPSVNIRGAADYVMMPLRAHEQEDGSLTWEELMDWEPSYALGYRHAIQTTSSIVIELFRSRALHVSGAAAAKEWQQEQ